jgi:16S rRNA (guanine(966)-N(2))-methyltransferase RsmD
MRIITGSAKGLKLKTPKGLDIRPTADRVKESVFNILAGNIEDASVADFFCGTGNLGLEALSRGAREAVFVDASTVSLTLARENAALAKLTDKAVFVREDAVQAVDLFVRQGRQFDLIFCDPPYNRGLVAELLHKIDAASILKPGGIVVVEHAKHETAPLALNRLTLRRAERYGETMVSFLTIDA